MKAYQLKITIKNSHPPIWRRCIIPAGITFSQLGVLFNEIMGWKGYHLFSFEFQDYGIRVEELDEDYDDPYYELEEASETLNDPYMENTKWFTYSYDFGDDWEHRVEVEEIVYDCGYTCPVVLKARGACPFEDCGGIYGYYRYLEALQDEENEEHQHLTDWVQDMGYGDPEEPFDPKRYDIEEVNESLSAHFQIRVTQKPVYETSNEIYEKLVSGSSVLTIAKSEADGMTSGRREAETEEWRALYEAGARVKELQPWETFWDMDLIALGGGWNEEVYVSILGKGGDCYGISVYEGLDGLNDFMMLTLSERMNISSKYAMFSQNNLTCYWGNREELSEKQRRIIKDIGYRFRGKNQWLYFMSFRKGYFPFNMDQDEVRRMTMYLEMLADAVEYYQENGLKTDFEHKNMFYYSKAEGKVTAEERKLPFTGCRFPSLTLTDGELLEDLRSSQKGDAVLEADIIYLGAAVSDKKYERPANPCLCLLAEAGSGMMLAADMAGPEKDAGIMLAQEVADFTLTYGAPKEIRVSNVMIEAILAHLCQEAGIRLRRVKRLHAVEDFVQGMKRLSY